MKPHPKDEPPASQSLGDLALDSLSDPMSAPSPAAAAPENAPPHAIETSLDSAAQPPVVAKLEAATRDLEMPSESDEPFRVVFWPLEKSELSPSEVAFYAAERADADVETESVEKFFANAARIESWMKDADRAQAKRFGDLIETLKSELEKPQVYLIGKVERTVAVIGKVEGGFAGVITTVVET